MMHRPATRVDHILVAVPSLPASMATWRAAGLAPRLGGRHPGGTVNALIRGPQSAYLELISAADRDGDAATRRVAASHGPVGWALGVDDIDAVRSSLIATGRHVGPVRPGSRTTPDGDVLAWRLCDIAAQPLDPVVPFLIQWDVAMPPGPADGPLITGLELGTPTLAETAALLAACGLVSDHGPVGDPIGEAALSDGTVTVTLRSGPPGIRSIRLRSDNIDWPRMDLDGLRVEASAIGDGAADGAPST